MKKTIAIVIPLMMVMSMLVCAVADVLSVEEIQEKLKEYGSYLQGRWEVEENYGKVLDNNYYSITIDSDGTGLGINSLGEVYAISYGSRTEAKIVFTNDADRIYLVLRTNDYGANTSVLMLRK